MLWCVELEMFNPMHKTRFINKKSLQVGLSSAFHFGISFVFVVLLFACGDIELNLGPKNRALATISQFTIGI